jgi:hypothetical protein
LKIKKKIKANRLKCLNILYNIIFDYFYYLTLILNQIIIYYMESDLSFFFAVDLPKEITDKDLQSFFDQSKIFYFILFQSKLYNHK